jgi:maltose phosphorylase
MEKVADNMYFSISKDLGYTYKMALRQRFSSVRYGCNTKNQLTKMVLDRVLRSPYIKQADVLQCFYFEEHFSGRIETQL